jgi:hypothetical protein
MLQARIATFVFLCGLAGCGCPMYLPGNDNHGQAGRLDLDGDIGNLPVGVATKLLVRHQDEGTFECKDNAHLDLHDVVAVNHTCRFIGTSHAFTQVDSATCRDGKCTATFAGTAVTVTPLVEGEMVLDVSGRLDDGRETSDAFTLTAAKYDPLSLYCEEASRCPGPHAVLVGATFQWRAVANGVPAYVSTQVEVTEDPPSGVVELTKGREGEVTVRAVKPGVATLRFHDTSDGRDDTVVRTVRVAGADEIVRGELHLRADTGDEVGAHDSLAATVGQQLRADVDLVGDHLPAVVENESVPLIVTWRLTDGSIAVGGAARVGASRGQVVAPARQASPNEMPAPRDLGHELLYFVGAPGTVQLTATLGAAKLEQSFDYRYARPAQPEVCPPPDEVYDRTGMGDTIEAGSPLSWTMFEKIRTAQTVTVSFSAFSADVRLRQRCGPAWAVPGVMGNDFAVQFPSPGPYMLEAVDLGGHPTGDVYQVLASP